MEKFYAFIGAANLLINGDGQGLGFLDGMAIDKFCEANNYRLDKGHFSLDDQEPFFGVCEITGLRAMVYEFEFVRMNHT